LTSWLLSFFFKPDLEALRILPETPTAGGACVYKVVVTNKGKRPLRNIEVFDHKLPHGLYAFENHPEYKNDLDWMEPGQQAVLRLAWRTPRRGAFKIPLLLAGSGFPTGLMRSLRRIGRREQFFVFPQFIKLPGIDFPMQKKFQAGGIGTSFRAGQSNEFLSTREYREGDRLRDIHWSSSARAGKLIVKEYVDEYFVRAGLFLDVELKRFEKHKCFESRISLCAGLADSFNNKNYLVDLFLNDRPSLHLQTGRGRDHFRHFLEALSAIEGDDHVYFEQALANIKEYAREMSGIVILLKDWDERRARFVQEVRETGLLTKVIIIRDQILTKVAEDSDIRVYNSKQIAAK
jgi:uncharacterized protein (DUF58 family)